MAKEVHLTIIGNCQAPVLARLLQVSLPEYCINPFVLHRESQEKLDSLVKDKNSIILAVPFQKVRGNPALSWQELPQEYPNAKVCMISNIYFEGFHPYWGYFYNLKNQKLYPEWDDYINYWIVHKFLDNRINDLFSLSKMEEMLCQSIYKDSWNRSQNELLKREIESDSITRISPLLDISIAENKKMFWSFNHPSAQIFNIMVMQILEYLSANKVEISNSFNGKEFLAGTKIPSYMDISDCMRHSSSIPAHQFKDIGYSWDELVEKHIAFLSGLSIEDVHYSLRRYVNQRPEYHKLLNF